MDAIIESALEKPYAFDDPNALTQRLVKSAEMFAGDMIRLVSAL